MCERGCVCIIFNFNFLFWAFYIQHTKYQPIANILIVKFSFEISFDVIFFFILFFVPHFAFTSFHCFLFYFIFFLFRLSYVRFMLVYMLCSCVQTKQCVFVFLLDNNTKNNIKIKIKVGHQRHQHGMRNEKKQHLYKVIIAPIPIKSTIAMSRLVSTRCPSMPWNQLP